MKERKSGRFRFIAGLITLLSVCTFPLDGQDRFQLELYGGISYLDPGDLDLFSKAEEEYNHLLYVSQFLGWEGFFINDFPRISNALPLGFRFKYRISERLSVSMDLEGFRRRKESTLSGSFSYSPSWAMSEAKEYDPYRLGLKGFSLMGGIHYRINAGRFSDLEIGAAAGWARASFDFHSTWKYSIDLIAEGFTHFSEDGGTLEGDGRGDGFVAKGMFRLNRSLGRRFGLFVETSATLGRLKSFEGAGRETRLGIPGETLWEGSWGVKREEIEVSWGSASVLVPTNYWEGWIADQRERDFVLNLSGVRLILGFYLRF